MNKETIEFIERSLLIDGDYVSVGFEIIKPDKCFTNMITEDTNASDWPYLRREIPHKWYVDKRETYVGFLSRDEAHILYNTALKFRGKKALEIGCWYGWSACHLALAGVELDVIDPLLEKADMYESVTNSLQSAGVLDRVNLVSGYSPQKVEELAEKSQRKWSLFFIDGSHEAPCPLNDAMICEQFAEPDALILFHDLNAPDVAQGLDYLKQNGWNTMIYQTMQIMGVAWRGNVEPVQHQPDPDINWSLPEHLKNYYVSELSTDSVNEFLEIITAIRPYTLLGEARLFSLYSLAKKICLEDIPGNFVECGSCKGGAAALLASVIQRYSLSPRLVYACDTFEGMPAPIEIDLHNGIAANETGFGVGTLKAPIAENIQLICKLLKVQDIVVPVKGLFAQTLPQYKSEIGNIALLHADGDWYESTMDIFNNLYDNVVPNGMIQVDDYGHWDGCQKALHEFERLRGEQFNLRRIDYTGVWFKKGEVINIQHI
ncbi:MAG: TylF/MycF/NovP-related O-methyltransferase [Nostoc sp.]|uniref:class I SAM-dependent methyltransferase n=1 Tax=Nostoc sp. TaxID=1180 RepID=UPI002FF90B9B